MISARTLLLKSARAAIHAWYGHFSILWESINCESLAQPAEKSAWAMQYNSLAAESSLETFLPHTVKLTECKYS